MRKCHRMVHMLTRARATSTSIVMIVMHALKKPPPNYINGVYNFLSFSFLCKRLKSLLSYRDKESRKITEIWDYFTLQPTTHDMIMRMVHNRLGLMCACCIVIIILKHHAILGFNGLLLVFIVSQKE